MMEASLQEEILYTSHTTEPTPGSLTILHISYEIPIFFKLTYDHK